MTKPNFGAGNASDALLRVAGSSAFIFPHGGSTRELRRAAERQARKEAKRALKAKQ